jgi:hypothetical protein
MRCFEILVMDSVLSKGYSVRCSNCILVYFFSSIPKCTMRMLATYILLLLLASKHVSLYNMSIAFIAFYRDHEFDTEERKSVNPKRKCSDIQLPGMPSRGAQPVRQHHKRDETGILVHKRIGIDIDKCSQHDLEPDICIQKRNFFLSIHVLLTKSSYKL